MSRSTLFARGFLAVFALSGCASVEEILPGGPGACDPTCGDGPIFVFDRLSFSEATEEDVSPGFDVDGLVDDCDVDDLVSPDGRTSIDNQFGNVLGVLPSGVASVLPEAVTSAVNTGRMTILLEVVGPADLQEDRAAALVVRYGGGEVLQGTGGTLLPGQTFALDEDPLLGWTREVEVGGGGLLAGPFALTLRLDFLGTPVRFVVEEARIDLQEDDQGHVAGVLGGAVPLDDAMAMVGLLGGDDQELGDQLEALVPLLVDVRLTEDGPCDAVSAAIDVHGVPAFVFGQ